MRPYLSLISARFRMLLQYRAAALAGFGTQLFWGLMRVMIFEAFYRSTTASQPMSLSQTVTYVWLGQATLALLPWNLDGDVQALIRSGSVAYELLRPVDLYGLWYCRALALRSAPTVLRAVPMLIIAWLFFGMQLPASWSAGAAWIASTFAALLLSAAITNILNISAIWTISGEGAGRALMASVMVFSGMMVPLPLFPQWSQHILDIMPFRGIVDIPFRLYTGHIPADHAPAMIAFQLVWTAALVILGRWMLSVGTRRMVVQGG